MKLVIDVESDNIEPSLCKNIWCISCIDFETEKEYVFRDRQSFVDFVLVCKPSMWIGHNILGYDIHVLRHLGYLDINPLDCIDTLVVSRLTDATRDKHSIEAWGEFFKIKKEHADVDESFFQQWSKELEDRCISDTRINLRVAKYLWRYVSSPKWTRALRIEHDVHLITYDIHCNGFGFDLAKAKDIRNSLGIKISILDKIILSDILPKVIPKDIITPCLTKKGTLNRSQLRFAGSDLLSYTEGATFQRIEFKPFNPKSPKDIVERLNAAGWKPTERTKGYTDAKKASRDRHKPTREAAREKLDKYHRTNTGWKISETNLSTLPETAPEGCKKLAERLLLQSRVDDLTEWIDLTREAPNGDTSIHGNFAGIGAWTHRVSHFRPNTANIPTEKPQDTAEVKELNRLLRTLWIARRGRLLVGVDADQIQLRILASYMQDERFTRALVEGDKSNGTDVHSLNVLAIGPACKGRRDAKTFIYSWLLGAGVERVAEILGCDTAPARQAREGFVEYYPGLGRFREFDLRRDARRGWFEGLDGRFIKIWGEDEDERHHYALGGYLQSGEKIVMSYAMAHRDFGWYWRFKREGIPFWLVNWVHDEWQVETVNDMETAGYISSVMADSIYLAGNYLGTKCPMKGSVNGGHDQLAIGKNWLETH
jgi:DNA polymerase-1